MRIGGGDNLPLGIDNPTIAAVMMAVAVSANPVTAGDIGLVFNRAGDQQCSERGAGQLATYSAKS